MIKTVVFIVSRNHLLESWHTGHSLAATRNLGVLASCAGLAPTELARHMVSIGTSVSFKREETDVSVYRAIIRSRRHVLAIRHGLQLWTSCCLFLTSLVLASLLLLLPRFDRLK